MGKIDWTDLFEIMMGKIDSEGREWTMALLSLVLLQVVMLLQYILPVLIMAYSYTMMVVTIWRKREIGEVNRHSKDDFQNNLSYIVDF